jgi:hypothetical protein
MISLFHLYLLGGFFVVLSPILVHFLFPWTGVVTSGTTDSQEKLRKILAFWIWAVALYLIIPIVLLIVGFFTFEILKDYIANENVIKTIVYSIVAGLGVFFFSVVLSYPLTKPLNLEDAMILLRNKIEKL